MTSRGTDTRSTGSALAQRSGAVLHRLAYLYLLRFPLLTALAIVGLCAGASGVFGSGIKALTHNIFDINWSLGLFFVSLMAFLAGLVVMHTSLLVLRHGRQRFFDGGDRDNVRYWLILPVLLVFVVALPVVGVAIRISTYLSTGREVLEAALGISAALLCLLGIYGIQQAVARRSTGSSHVPQISEDKGRGYLGYENGQAISILPGHVASAVLLLVTGLLYAVLGIVKFYGLGEPPLFPALAYILLLAMILCWLLSGAAFFLDRYRIPVLMPLLLWLGITAYFSSSDYTFPVVYPDGGAWGPSSSEPGRIGADSEGKMIVVASNGGGIQAAAWTAQVLTGLEKECRKKCDLEFDQSVHLISSVSGGTIGTMYFLNEYEGGRLPENPDELDAIVDRTEGSSLDEISWGVLYPDLIRTFFPNHLVWRGWDRGRALETAWLRNDTSWDARRRIQQGLATWRKDAEDRNRPAVIFNTAVVETGQRLPLATTDLPQDSPGDLSYDRYFENVNPKPDIPVVTAARLSASFPYVSPAARAAVEGRTDHLVDGGYYDNYGISSLVEWLDEELRGKSEVKKVLVLEIRGARSGLGDERSTESLKCQTEPVVKPVPGEGQEDKRTWFSQILAPPQGALNVRNTGQRTHNDTELDLLQDKWRAEGDVEIMRALFEFDGANPPLSWHLTDQQKEKIRAEWHHEVNDPLDSCAGWDRVQDFLSSEVK